MNLQQLSSSSLRTETLNASKREKHETAILIEHLIEVDRRKLYLTWGHGSLFAYINDELGYERGAASLRVSAVRAAQAITNLPEKIETGELCLKTIRTVESFAYHEAKARGKELTQTEKKKIYAEVAHLPTQKVEARLAQISTSPKFRAPQKEEDRAVKDSKRFISFTVTEEMYEFVELAKEVLSHKHPGASTSEIYNYALEYLVRSKHPKFKAERAKKRQDLKKEEETSMLVRVEGHPVGEEQLKTQANVQPVERNPVVKSAPHTTSPSDAVSNTKRNSPSTERSKKRSRYIPAKDTHALWADYDGGGCTYTDAQTGKRCGSKHCLQRDHVQPYSLGGGNTRENLSILCRQHNAHRSQMELALLKELQF